MKRIKTAAALLSMSVLLLTACGKPEFGMKENTGRQMTIEAKKADKDSFFMTGQLEVGEDEQIVITSGLEKGSVRIEIIGTPEEQSIESIPEFDSEPVIRADISAGEGASGTVPAGDYMLKATCLEKATGSIQVEVKPAS